MQAAVIETLGQPPQLVHRQPPRADPDQLTIAVTAAPITPLDVLCSSGTSYFGAPPTPYVPGVQGVGVVQSGSTSIPAGTLVWFASSAGMQPGDGSMRSVATASEHDVVPLPAGTDPGLAGALGLSAVAAWLALTWRGELSPGEQVLVLGAGGVVGQAAVQLARSAGARRVIGAARSEAARERARAAGADAVVPLDDADDVDSLTAAIRSQCDGPLDLVLDPLFGIAAIAAMRVLRADGRLVNLGSSAAPTAAMESATLRGSSLRILGYTNNALSPQVRREALTHVMQEAGAGRLTVDYEPVPLADVAQAWVRHVDGRANGRVVLMPEPALLDRQET